ncbi:MAG TPA: zinc-dependent metalloprotease family protein, partial [Saprospiraceae bacterium]|nr:zinc-dependent metalloprotease family protein [Saprospiraceae bacterium]
IRDENGMMYIDPFQRNDITHCIAYYKKDLLRNEDWTCDFVEERPEIDDIHQQRMAGDCMFRSYRLALATTAEYSNYFGATSAAQSAIVMSAVVTAVNRVNEVYEHDVTVRLILVGNTSLLFYYNASTDPYTNGNGSTMLGQNQTTCDNIIGSGNYDIGHVFSTGGGGVAYLGCVCNNSQKAGGVTGNTAPVGDGFYIDYVAHEMGHQFGGSHTFNGTAGSCGGGNRSPTSAYETGSGTTIMAYAGICGAQDVQPHSDAYFHARSIFQIGAHVTSTNCAAFISLSNSAPVANSIPDKTIPISTPFVLTASAIDGNSDPLTYCWEEYDLEGTSSEPPASNDIDGPLFRSFEQTASPSRYFPRLSDLVNNTNYTWEVLPSVSRSMTFRMTVRDYHNIAGCTDEDDVVVTTTSTSGPFLITSQNSGATWMEGGNETITWNVANTTAAPVSCANVEIRMSYDGGFTYPTVLAASEPNDGSATISVPPGTTVDGRVMVKAVGNIFFDINNADITVEAGLPNFTIALNPSTISECIDGTVQTTVNVGSFMGFNDPVTLSLLNTPAGSVVTFIPPVVVPGNSSTLTITNLNTPGSFTPTVRGTSTTGNKDAVFTINLLTTPTVQPTLQLPANNATAVLMTPLLDWASVAGSSQYVYQIASDDLFGNIVVSGVAMTDQYQVLSGLAGSDNYYWRVRAQNSCGTGPWSTVFAFTTSDCFALLSPNVPVAIPESGTPIVTSTFTTPIELQITDVNIISLIGTHTWIDDLKFYLKSPENTEILFWNRPCNNGIQNFNINFDDEASSPNHPCPPTNGLTYKPGTPLTPFDGQQSNGTWTLKVEDIANQDGGSLNSWGLKVCGLGPCQLVVTETSGTGTGTLPGAFNCANAGDTIIISSVLAGQTINIGATAMNLNKNIVIISQANNINITGSGSRAFDIATGVLVEFSGMMITAGSSLTGGAIRNMGTLTLNNVAIEKNASVSGATLIHNSGGLKLVGNCQLNQ